MTFTGKLALIIVALSIWLAIPSYAQLGGGQQDAAKILNNMPPDLLAKVQSLAQMLQQGIKDGKLTDEEVKQGMMSGHLGEKLKQLSPEAGQLLEEISDASKQGNGGVRDGQINPYHTVFILCRTIGRSVKLSNDPITRLVP
ncbi:MAG: hypothetical protein HY038_00190 [Nitrospirae bacterium]|nr:hypothetical protein [Nitrospirota bacterium]